jgi:hypothetical protein
MPLATDIYSRNVFRFGRIDGGRGFQTGVNVFRIGVNTFYDCKNKNPMKIPEFKRSRIGIIAEFRGIPNGFPNQVYMSFPTIKPPRERDQVIIEIILSQNLDSTDITRINRCHVYLQALFLSDITTVVRN